MWRLRLKSTLNVENMMFARLTKTLVLALLLAALAVAVAKVYAVSITVLVADENGRAVADVVVKAFQGQKEVGRCTTNSSGMCTMDITNTTTTFLAGLGTGKYILRTVVDYLPPTVELNASELYKVYIATNTSYNVPFKLNATASGTVLDLKTNCTVYTAESIALEFEKEVQVGVFEVLKFVKVTYDGTSTNETKITIAVTAPVNVTAYYVREVKVTTNMLILIGLLAIVILVILILVFLSRARKRRVIARTIGPYA